MLTWSENCLLTSKAYRGALAAQGSNPAVAEINNPAGANFKITDTKLYVPLVTLAIRDDDNKLLEQLKTEFKRTIIWNKYRSVMSNQTKNNNLNYLIDPRDYLSYHLKMKMIELLFQCIMYQN